MDLRGSSQVVFESAFVIFFAISSDRLTYLEQMNTKVLNYSDIDY